MNKTILGEGDTTLVLDGRVYKVFVCDDDDFTVPWNRSDGHGPVSEWTTRDKRPGEWILSQDRSSRRFYDAAGAMRIALSDGWGLGDEAKAELLERLAVPRVVRRSARGQPGIETVTIPGRDRNKPLTRGEIAAEAVRRDFEFLQGWCDDDWRYIGVVVVHVPHGVDAASVKIDYAHALWGIESDAGEYMFEVATGLAGEIAAELDAERLALRGRLVTLHQEISQMIKHAVAIGAQLSVQADCTNLVALTRRAVEPLREQRAEIINHLREIRNIPKGDDHG